MTLGINAFLSEVHTVIYLQVYLRGKSLNVDLLSSKRDSFFSLYFSFGLFGIFLW